MSTVRNGATQFSCHAILENRRPIPDRLNNYEFDAILYGARAVGKSQQVHCKLRYYEKIQGQVPAEGFYDITARVSQ